MTRWLSPGALAIWAGFYVTALFILLWGNDSMPWRLGQRIDQDVTARVAFEYENQLSTQQAKRAARDSAPDVYLFNDAVVETVFQRLQQLLDQPESAAPRPAGSGARERLSAEVLDALRKYAADDAGKAAYADVLAKLRNQFGNLYIASSRKDSLRREGLQPPVSILRPAVGPDRKVISSDLVPVTDRESVQKVIEQTVAAVAPASIKDVMVATIERVLLGSRPEEAQALWQYDQLATGREMKEAEASVRRVMDTYRAGDPIIPIPAGKLSVELGEQELPLLRAEHESFLRAQKTDPVLRRERLLTDIGMAVVVLLITLALVSYTVLYQARVLHRPVRVLGIVCLLLAMILLSRLNERAQYPYDLPVEFAVAFVVIATALLTIAYDQRLALGVAGNLAILATLASRGDFALFVTVLSAAGVVIFSLREIRSRSKVIVVGVVAALTAFTASASMGLIQAQDPKYLLVHALAAGAAAIGAGFFVQGILPNFERLFGVATSITMLEWSDASRPLLRRLAQEAPGTYSHSLLLSQMAEEAANAIGANGLLARVGALYHDIGKITKAEYFVENQEARMNRHERLSPTMSLLIIVGHVKDGVEMARAYGLPRVLHQFIAEHHGTTVVRYFHHAANELAARKKDREIPDTEFRYPGPKPRSKETAILMLCDGCEGSVRALSEPTPGRIESTVHHVLMDRLTDGQFDECDITLRELHLVEQSLVKNLAAIHHGRIKYPKAVSEEGAEVQGPTAPTGELRPAPRSGEMARQA